MSEFGDFGLSEAAQTMLLGLGPGQPTPLQGEAIPALLSKRDLFARAPAGAGEDAAMALTVIERVIRDGPTYNPTALILVPSRELAIQLHETIFQLSSRGAIANVLGVFEGKPVTSQIGPLKHGVDIVVGTPVRVLEHVKRRTLRIEQIKILFLDRVDEMLDQGHVRDVESIIGSTPKTRQTGLFSATIPQSVLSLAHKHLDEPELIGIEPGDYESAAAPEGPKEHLVNLYFSAGRGAGVTPSDLVGAITGEGELSGDRIGEVRIKENFSLAAVPGADADGIVRKLRTTRIRGRKVTVRLERFKSKKNR
ncbi:MAG: DEAD/DEAH box helicase [Solirubrobacterales bacterium]|nr:DEAD/DEAH box helicase [Solirubrobacterales bacterium]